MRIRGMGPRSRRAGRFSSRPGLALATGRDFSAAARVVRALAQGRAGVDQDPVAAALARRRNSGLHRAAGDASRRISV